jgi:hypothetical protein
VHQVGGIEVGSERVFPGKRYASVKVFFRFSRAIENDIQLGAKQMRVRHTGLVAAPSNHSNAPINHESQSILSKIVARSAKSQLPYHGLECLFFRSPFLSKIVMVPDGLKIPQYKRNAN